MDTLEFETDGMRPVSARCQAGRVWVTLKDGRGISAPLAWYPFLSDLSEEQLNAIELMFDGIWWEHADEGVSIKSMFMGWKAPGGVDPSHAHEAA